MGRKVNRFFMILSFITFFVVTTFSLVLIYDAYLTSKDGEFCYFKQQYEVDYDFEFPKGYRCDFLFTGLLEPAIILISFNIIAQLVLWLLYKLFKLKIILFKMKFIKEKQVPTHDQSSK